MGVDAKGNFALFYGVTLPSMDQNTLRPNKVSFGASATANVAMLFGKQVGDIGGSGFSIAGSGFSPLGLGGGGSIDFSFGSDNSVSFTGFTLSGGVGTPGASLGITGLGVTWSVLYSAGDYKTLFDTKWDLMGVKEAEDLTNAVNDGNMRDPVGFWQYLGSEEIYEPVKGEQGSYTVSIKQRFRFSTSGKGATNKMKDVTTVRSIPTGIKLKQVDKITLKSENYAEPD